MKKLSLATLSTLALTLPCTSVFAVDGTITVNGVVTDQTCTLQGGGAATGLKDLTISLPTVPKSRFRPGVSQIRMGVLLYLKNATGTGTCDTATTKAFQGIHLSTISPPDDLDATDKTLLVNKATDAPTKNPVFIQISTGHQTVVDLSLPWGTQAKSYVNQFRGRTWITYYVVYFTWNWIVDAQNVTATINYTLHYN
ncbi:fimbrial protein [Acinetobacter guillouiae]|uniref:fimbrial protein n=1 Tax=Acinetobacter guillouiae TaxID=106649 RepID=UPI00125F412E|nr:fimbrial protein [Acinetobacter guillouiae]